MHDNYRSKMKQADFNFCRPLDALFIKFVDLFADSETNFQMQLEPSNLFSDRSLAL
jgi:hypothetical protein